MSTIQITDDKSGRLVATVHADIAAFTADIEESGWSVLAEWRPTWASGIDASDWASDGIVRLNGIAVKQGQLSYAAAE